MNFAQLTRRVEIRLQSGAEMWIAFCRLRGTDDVQETPLGVGGVIQAFEVLRPVDVVNKEPATGSDKVNDAGQD